ncbi:hypothetical protein [Actinomadura sp. NPDC049753]|uniref:hypothetical protein n=1 Tax=Actinomadura sp. NPDC049753 TaxID=3154739 RepID=UPI00342397E3
MRGVPNLLAILVAALAGGIAGCVVTKASTVGVISAEGGPAAYMLGGAAGAFFAVIAAVVVSFGKTVSIACLTCGLANLGLAGCMIAFGAAWATWGILGFGLLAGVFADFLARRPAAVQAAGTGASQGQDPTSSGDASQK